VSGVTTVEGHVLQRTHGSLCLLGAALAFCWCIPQETRESGRAKARFERPAAQACQGRPSEGRAPHCLAPPSPLALLADSFNCCCQYSYPAQHVTASLPRQAAWHMAGRLGMHSHH
jgi:hypothetical protein